METTIILILLVVWVTLSLYIGFMRNNLVRKFRIRLSHEERDFLIKRVHEGKLGDKFRRYDSLPPYWQMLLEFWKPLRKYEKPLGDYYNDNQ